MAATSVALLTNGTATSPQKAWLGGRTSIITVIGALNGATIKVQLLGPDNTTLIDVATLAATGITAIDLPPGSYQVTITVAVPTAVTVVLAPVSYFR